MGALVLCGSPIGNAADASERLRETLASFDTAQDGAGNAADELSDLGATVDPHYAGVSTIAHQSQHGVTGSIVPIDIAGIVVAGVLVAGAGVFAGGAVAWGDDRSLPGPEHPMRNTATVTIGMKRIQTRSERPDARFTYLCPSQSSVLTPRHVPTGIG